MTHTDSPEFLTVPDVMQLLGISPSRVHRLIEDRALIAVRRDGVLRIPADCFVDGEVLSSLRGTVTLLLDQGLENDEVVQWLMTANDHLGARPFDELRAGHKAGVRRAAQLVDPSELG